jgi:5'-methylthioadenosine phosphorylase
MTSLQAEIGVFGGSGFYQLVENPETVQVETPYGLTSGDITIGTVAGRRVAFLPRHGATHAYPPHLINYRANVWAFKKLGITRVISPCAAGSLQKYIRPGSFVICDQYVDRTNGRKDTFYDGPVTTHVSAADPYCPEMRQYAIDAANATGIEFHPEGTVVVIQGPRFSTRAESNWFRGQGWEVINMTQYPEAHLVKELEMCVVNISLITDYDTGIPGVEPVSHEEVLKVFAANNEKLKTLLFKMIESLPTERKQCGCGDILSHARV